LTGKEDWRPKKGKEKGSYGGKEGDGGGCLTSFRNLYSGGSIPKDMRESEGEEGHKSNL